MNEVRKNEDTETETKFRSTFCDRYETGWQGHDGTLENVAEYFSKKHHAMMFAEGLFQRKHFKSTYVYDRCLNFTRWFDGNRWSRIQTEV